MTVHRAFLEHFHEYRKSLHGLAQSIFSSSVSQARFFLDNSSINYGRRTALKRKLESSIEISYQVYFVYVGTPYGSVSCLLLSFPFLTKLSFALG